MSNNPTPEQLAELEENLKKMSPDELKNFQKSQCIFCQIVDGKVQSKKVYEDNKIVAILDINPASPGHMLVMPKEHYMIMPQIPEDEINHLFGIIKTLSQISLRALEVEGTNILIANGLAAGQKSQHFMIHIIPRKEGDEINFIMPQKTHSDEELEAVRLRMADLLMGKKQSPLVMEDKMEAVSKKESVFPTKDESWNNSEQKDNIDLDEITRIFKQ